MREAIAALLTALAIAAAPVPALAQGKTTADPNAAPRSSITAQVTDPGLNNRVTYDSGYTRLHDVAADLTRTTGVSILSGKSKEDWRVRDIPLVVCVKDMPLGALLSYIAKATHTRLGAEKIDNTAPKTYYRIYRRSADEADIDNYFTDSHKTRLAQAKWQWNAMSAYGKSQAISGIPDTVWALGKVIASLGSDSWDKLIDGRTIRISERSAPDKEAFDNLYRLAWYENEHEISSDKRYVVGQIPDEGMQYAVLYIKLVDKGELGKTEVQVNLTPIEYKMSSETPDAKPGLPTLNISSAYDVSQHWHWNDTLDKAALLKDKLPGLSTYPETGNAPSLEQDMNDPEMIYLNPDDSKNWPAELTRKITLTKPENVKDLTFADVQRIMASAGGVNIISEDFTDQYLAQYRTKDTWFSSETSIADIILKFRGRQWFYSPKDNVLICWADVGSQSNPTDSTPSSHTWRQHHRYLLSEDYLNSIKQKLSGNGVDIDDAVRLAMLPDGSFTEWISYSWDQFELSRLRWFGDQEDSCWWRLYDALSPDDKLMAKSPSGLPLSKLDPVRIAACLRAQKLKRTVDNTITMPVDEESDSFIQSSDETRDKATSDPNVIASGIMRLTSRPETYRQNRISTPEKSFRLHEVPKGLKLFKYQLVINCKMDGMDQETKAGCYIALPIRTPEREAEIIKAAKEDRK